MTATAPEARSTGPGAPPPGRRERKKQRTREALIDAAFRLFAEKGFDATTVEEIADAVDVSARTFFRYFASKEDVALTFQEEQHQAILAALAERPPDEPVITALRRTAVGLFQSYERGELGFATDRFECMMELTSDSTTLMAGSLEHAQKKQIVLTQAVADRMGVDPESDLRPHVVASAVICAFHAASDVRRQERLGYEKFSEVIDAAFALLETGVNFPSADPGD